MKLLLNKDYRLRGWKGAPFYLERFSDRKLLCLPMEAFAFLIKCDGKTEINPGEWPAEPQGIREAGIISPCGEGDELLPEQEYILYPNRKLRKMEISVTGRCNMSCKHCFNTKDAKPRSQEPTQEQLFGLIKTMDECGIAEIRINGGEPMVRKDLLAITGELARRNIIIKEFLSNGYALTEEFLDAMEEQGHKDIQWFISFDGLGHHDWLRGVKGAEERVKKNIRMLRDRGYYVHLHQCVWKDSLESIRPTILWAQELGVASFRILPVEPSLRWVEVAPDQTVSNTEWLEYLPGFLDWWYENGIHMALDVWSYWVHSDPAVRRVAIIPDILSRHTDNNQESCPTMVNRPFIDADGRIVPCMPLSGFTAALGPDYGNVYQGDDLHELLTDSAFSKQVCCTFAQLKERNPKCRSCNWHDICSMGCRAEGMARSRDINGLDPRMCEFFENGYYEKFIEIAKKHGLSYR